jgi:hypothetical protein
MRKIGSQDPGSVMNIPDLIFENLVSVYWIKILKFFNAYPDPGSCQSWTRDGKKIRSGIRDRNPGSATLVIPNYRVLVIKPILGSEYLRTL